MTGTIARENNWILCIVRPKDKDLSNRFYENAIQHFQNPHKLFYIVKNDINTLNRKGLEKYFHSLILNRYSDAVSTLHVNFPFRFGEHADKKEKGYSVAEVRYLR